MTFGRMTFVQSMALRRYRSGSVCSQESWLKMACVQNDISQNEISQNDISQK
jgi:hypothetical protein